MVAANVLTPSVGVWLRLWQNTRGLWLPGMLTSTFVLMAGVVGTALALGAGLAWLVAAYRFPGRRAFSWLLVLPLAVPAYILGFVYVSLLDAPGPVQTGLRALFGAGVWFPEIRTMPAAIAVMALTLYPYVYLLARSALSEQAAEPFEAARSLGQGRLGAARRVVLPLARPSLAAGAALVAMETLTDFATVRYFNVQTVSVGIFQLWRQMYDRPAATELASLVLVLALTIIAAERGLRGRARYYQRGAGGAGRGIEPVRLLGWRAAAATGACTLVLVVTFAIPVAQLVRWSSVATLRGPGGGLDPRYFGFLLNSVVVAGVAALACVAFAAVIVNAVRLGVGRGTGVLARLTTVGYAMPGPVVAIGVLVLFAGLDTGLDAVGVDWGGWLVTGSVLGLVYAYVARFMALGYHSLDASLDKVTPAMTDSAFVLGAPPRRVLTRVHLPLIRSGLGMALVLVIVEALKELPIVLLLRPFDFKTLPVWVFQNASESRWELIGLPALTIVAAAALPVVILLRRTLRDEQTPS